MTDELAGAARPKRTSWVERHVGLVFLGAIMVLAVGGYSLVWWLTREDFEMTGTVKTSRMPGGDFTITPGTCEVVDKRGVESTTESGRIHVFRRDGEIVVGIVPAARSRVELTRAGCQVFDVALVETSSTYNKARVWRGHVRATCQLETGTIEVSLAFGKCV